MHHQPYHQILANKGIIDSKLFDGNIYFTACDIFNTEAEKGKLYKYNIYNSELIQLSNHSVSELFCRQSGSLLHFKRL